MAAIDVATLPKVHVREALGGVVVSVDDETGAARVRYVPGESLNNSVGAVFGGYLAAMVDDAAGLATWFGGGRRRFATAQLSVNFLRPAKPGEALLADVVITGIGGRKAFAEVKIRRETDNQIVVTGTAVQSFLGGGVEP